MPRRYFNWKLAIVLLISIVVLGVTAFGLRQWQRTNRADQGLILGNKAYDEQRWDEAAENLGSYLVIHQNDVPVLMKYAEAQLKIRPLKDSNRAHADRAYRNVLRIDKNHFKAALLLTELCLLRGMPGEAELIASKYIENNDNPEPDIRMMLASALAEQRKFSEASLHLENIIQEHPDQILAYEMMGQLVKNRPDDVPVSPEMLEQLVKNLLDDVPVSPEMLEQLVINRPDDPNSPESWFNEAVKNNPSSAMAYTIRAAFYRASNDIPKALADLEQAERLDLSDPNVELRLAGEFISVNNLDKAEKHLKAVQSTSPTNQELWNKWTELALKSKLPEKMLEVAENGLRELASQPWDFMPIATELFIRSGQHDRAAECISEMNQKDIDPIRVTFLEGLLAFNRGRVFEAIKYWNESLKLVNALSPAFRLALTPKVRLPLSSALSIVGDNQSALQQLRILVSENPNHVTGHLELARLLAQVELWAESSEHAATAKRLSTEKTEASLLYLQAQMQLRAAGLTGQNVLTFQDLEKQLSELEKAASNLPEFKLLKFRHALLQSNFTDARALVNQLKKDYPPHIKTSMAEVELLNAQDKTDEAMLILSKALEEFPQAVEPVIYLADLLYRQGDNEKCEAIIKEALERIHQPVARRELGLGLRELYIKWNQNDNVYSLLNTLVQELPEDIILKRLLLFCEQVTSDYERAQKLVNDIKSLEGEEGWQWRYEQAKVWFLSEDFEARYTQIVSLLQENLQVNPNDQGSRMLLAIAYDRSGALQMAISTYRDALNRSPDEPRIVAALVAALYRAREDKEAERLLGRVSQQRLDNSRRQQLQVLSYQSYLRRDELDSASDVLEDFLSNDPDNKTARLALADLKIQQGRFDEAGELLDKLKIQDPNSLRVAVAQVNLNVRQNKSAEAFKLCDEIISNFNNGYAYMLRAETYSSFGQNDEAREDFEHAAAIEPNNVEVWLMKSEFYSSIGLLEKAIADIKNALSLDSSDIRIQKQAISLLLESDNVDNVRQGKAIFTEALKSNPDDIDLWLFKVESLLSERTAEATDEAEQILRKMTEDQPEISRAWELLGTISLSKGQAGKAMEIAFQGLSHKPDDKALLLLKARAEAARTPILAIPTLKAILEEDPNNTDAAVLLAKVYYAGGEPEKAVNLLELQLASCVGTPKEKDVKITLAKVLDESGRKEEAQQILNTLPAPDYVEFITDIAKRLQATGHSEEAIPLYQKALEKEPDSPSLIVINNLAWILCENKGRHQEALELAEEGLKINPNYIDLIDTRGFIYYQMGEFDKAVEDFTTCIRLYPTGNPTAIGSYFRLANTFDKLGQTDKAAEHRDQAFKLYRDLDAESQVIALLTLDDEAKRLLKKLQEGN